MIQRLAGVAFATALGATACARASLTEATKPSMGSTLRVSVWSSDAAGAQKGIDAVFADFERLESLMSVWRDGSDIKRLNDAAGHRPVQVSPEVLEVLAIARQISEWTGGKFDVTFAALSDLWRFDHDQDNTIPDASAVRQRLPLIDYRGLILDNPAGTAFLTREGMRAHLGGIGKGYAIDRGAAMLRGRGFRDFLIQAGGDLYVSGFKDGRPWRLAVQDPRGPAGSTFATLDLSDGTFSTSGDYERAFVKNGRRYHHILDPQTGEPAAGCRSVTIVTDRAVIADGLSTGVFLLGPSEGMALVRRLPHVEAVIVTAHNEVLVTPGLKDRLALVSQPTDAP